MTETFRQRVRALDWKQIAENMLRDGYALTAPLLTADVCSELIECYPNDSLFRSQVVMQRLGFGRGEYKYFKYPLPKPVAALRTELYPCLARIANAWAVDKPFPADLEDFLKICRAAGQEKPTPLLLKYEAGDFNCLHQDLYGDVAFPLQVTILLSQPEIDHTGGEFVLVEQRPRMQSRPMVIRGQQGQAILFPTRYRALRGARGTYRTNLRHGVSQVHSGRRFTLGIIFHDAK